MEDLVSSAKLYVGNLSYDTSESSLRTLFEAHGEVVSVNLITDRDSGRPKGFAFVEMGAAEEAEAAKTALDGTQVDGRTIKVDSAKEQQPRPPRSGGGRGYGGGGGFGGGGGGGGGYGGGGRSGGGNRW
jgi:RNA recognition motif-containing protein